jgi:hypothetical protein
MRFVPIFTGADGDADREQHEQIPARYRWALL